MDNPEDILEELSSAFLDESLSDKSAESLYTFLVSNPEYLVEIRHNLILRERLISHFSENHSAFPDSVVDNINGLTKKSKHKIISFLPLISIAAAIIILSVISLFVISSSKPVVASYSDCNSDKHTEISLNKTLKKSEGLYRLNLNSGASVILDAPFKVKIVDDKTILLMSGLLVAHCPTPESTITVIKGDKQVTDLGTAFGVDSLQDALEVIVFSGSVNAQSGENEQELQMLNSLQINESHEFIKIPYDSSKYDNALSSLINKNTLQTTGTVKVVNPWDLSNIQLAEQNAVIACERQGIFGRIELRTEEFANNERPSEANPYRINIDENAPLTSYLLRAHRSRSNPNKRGSITFPEPIVAVITQQKNLILFENQFSIPHSNSKEPNLRGLESMSKRNDSFTISPDRTTLSFDFSTERSVDDLRILTETSF